MKDALPWLGFWVFASCVALAIGFANTGPSRQEIDAMARKEVAKVLAEKGSDPAFVACIINPPAWGQCKPQR